MLSTLFSAAPFDSSSQAYSKKFRENTAVIEKDSNRIINKENKYIVELNVVIIREDFNKCKTHSRIIKFSNGLRQFVVAISEIYLTIKTLVTLEL